MRTCKNWLDIPIGFVALTLLMHGVPARAQFNSRSASVTLNATLPESLSVRPQFVDVGQTSDQTTRFEVLHVFFQWRLRPGQSFQVESNLSTAANTEWSPGRSSFVNLRELAVASSALAFRPAPENQFVLLGAVTEGEERPVGTASIIVRVPKPDPARARTLRLCIAAL